MKVRYGVSGPNVGPLCVCVAILSLFLLSQGNALCQVPTPPREPDAKGMVAEMRSALEKHDTVQANEISRELRTLGKTVLPAIRESLPDCNEAEVRQFISILTGISGGETTQLLIQWTCQSPDPKITAQAIHAIGNRPIDFALTTNQIERLVTEIRSGYVLNAAAAAQLLARSQKNDRSQVVSPMLERFMQEITSPTNPETLHGSYVSPRVYTLNLFLLSFVDLHDKAAADVRAALKTTTAQETQKWLTLALGMCGDQSVAHDIRDLIANDPDTSFRSVAVRAYARSHGEKAVPLLQTLLADSSQSEYDRLPDGSPVYPIRIAAQDELARLKSKPAGQ